MKFIPGTKFINNTTKNTRSFKRGVLYVLNNISKTENGISYVFSLPQTGERKEVVFESAQQADNYLSHINVN